MAHCNFSFLMELYKAWGGRNKSGWYESILEGGAPCTPILELRALLPNLAEETELGKGAAEGKDQEQALEWRNRTQAQLCHFSCMTSIKYP